MDHMTEEQIIDLIDGEGPPEAEAHLAECSKCSSVQRLWVDRIEALREMTRERLEESELHRLRVLFRQLGPGEGRAPRWIARLVRSSSAAPATARGLVSGQIMEFNAGPYVLMLRVGAQGSRSTVSVTGQIASVEEDCEIGGTFALTPQNGRARLSDVDQFGEFNVTEVEPGSYRGTWWFGDQLLVVHDVEIGTDEEP
jgi:anti-sigma factor RsiW